MPNIRSAKKRMRQSVKRREHNRVQRAYLRGVVKKVRMAKSADDAREAYAAAESALDRAARKHLIARNKAARTKHRLQAHIAKL